MQAKARDIALHAKDNQHWNKLDAMIKSQVVPEFLQYAVTKSGVFKNCTPSAQVGQNSLIA
jgi:hypothetical protein